MKAVHVLLDDTIHKEARIQAIRVGCTLKEYITRLIIQDTAKNKKESE